MKIYNNFELIHKNTLCVPSKARYYAEISSIQELQTILDFARKNQLPVIPLGEGSNVVLGEILEALVVHINLKGRSVVNRDHSGVRVRVGAGENWHEFVCWTLENKAYGLENLSLIPGTVGAAPVQNIGAYGVEFKDYLVFLEVVNTESGVIETFDRHSCLFGYRNSLFRKEKRDKYIITSVTLDLDSVLKPRLGYGSLEKFIRDRLGDRPPSAFDISQAVCDIRQAKLPAPSDKGNVGSFFKNPKVSQLELERLKREYTDIIAYPVECGWKLAAGWLIDQAGLKGVRNGSLGTYKNHALVLVNYGGATGNDVLSFAQMIQRSVYNKFGVFLEIEPRIYINPSLS